MALKKPISKPAQRQDDDAPPKQRKASWADKFDDAPKGAAASMPAGKHKVIITGFEITENDKGVSAVIEYTGHADSEVEDKKLKQYYKIQDAAGEVGQGAGFLKADLEKLGFEDVSGADLEETLAEIVSKEIVCMITVKQNGQWTNAYLDGVVED